MSDFGFGDDPFAVVDSGSRDFTDFGSKRDGKSVASNGTATTARSTSSDFAEFGFDEPSFPDNAFADNNGFGDAAFPEPSFESASPAPQKAPPARTRRRRASVSGGSSLSETKSDHNIERHFETQARRASIRQPSRGSRSMDGSVDAHSTASGNAASRRTPAGGRRRTGRRASLSGTRASMTSTRSMDDAFPPPSRTHSTASNESADDAVDYGYGDCEPQGFGNNNDDNGFGYGYQDNAFEHNHEEPEEKQRPSRSRDSRSAALLNQFNNGELMAKQASSRNLTLDGGNANALIKNMDMAATAKAARPRRRASLMGNISNFATGGGGGGEKLDDHDGNKDKKGFFKDRGDKAKKPPVRSKSGEGGPLFSADRDRRHMMG